MDQNSLSHLIPDISADRVKDIISDECTIVYTDFALHVAPIASVGIT